MASEYYTHTTFPATSSFGSSAQMRAELDLIDSGFAKLPVLTGNAGKFVLVNSGANAQTVASTLSESGSTVTASTNLSVGAALSVGGAATLSSTLAVAGVATLTANPVLSSGTNYGVVYLNASKAATSGSALTFDGTNLVTTGGVRLDNAQYYYGKNAAGSAVRLLGVNSGNVNYVGAIDGGPTEVNYGAASTITAQYWNISGSEGMRLTSTGLGIGQTPALTQLDIRQTTTYALGINTASRNYSWRIDPSSSDALVLGTRTTSSDLLWLSTSGNLGLGVTPSAWAANNQALEGPYGAVSLGASLGTTLAANAYYGSGAWRYKVNSPARLLLMDSNSIQFYNAGTGTAGNAITFTQAMTLDASGNLGVGTNSPAQKLDVVGTGRFNSLEIGANNSDINNSNLNAIAFKIQGTERMRIDTSGALGVGIIPSAWISNAKALQVGAFLAAWTGSNGSANLGFGAYEGGAVNTYKYLTTGDSPTMYQQLTGTHRWFTAPSGTVNNTIAFTQAMTLDAAGNLGVGTTSPISYGAGYATLALNSSLAGVLDLMANNLSQFRLFGNGSEVRLQGVTNTPMNFYTNSTQRFLIDAAGNVLVNGVGGLGYGTGSGGAITQATSRTTGVTLNKTNGAITLVSAAGSASWQSFTVTNSTVAATDVVRVVQASGTDLYQIHVTAVAAGSFRITFATTGGTTTEQPVFNFAVLKAVTA